MSRDTGDDQVLSELRMRFASDDAEPVAGMTDLCEAARVASGAARGQVLLEVDGRELVLASSGTAKVGLDTSEVEVRVPFRVEGVGECGALRLLAPGPTNDVVVVGALAAAAGRAIDLEVVNQRVFDLGERAARADETLAEAVGQLVHDINNPLAAASMSLEIARDEVSEGLVAQLMDRAIASTTRMKRMVTDLLTFSTRPARGQAALGEVLTPLAGLLDGLSAERLGAAGTEVVIPLVADDLAVVLLALLENAVKFARADEPATVRVTATADRDQVRLEVADAGRGIAPEHRERVFLPTLRLDRKIPGSGLGLATVRRLVHAAGGTATITDSPWGGVTVVLTFPTTLDSDSAATKP